ncbi:DUF2142 domain-containing protein [Pyxidicoccus xibeiensis]|uniref:DUF2142 domain-containing protein n=1 Tax=Pyxidicoccus xibeiensis TaxID=2906759 RepID=UPI0020A7958F|nr:DUF2142 domain-containing protein [Pyxidicoccus xibeiensis]MCP3138244.1 DUF2142 domain-containing protein [Pyxidicoccus xibeiensis]
MEEGKAKWLAAALVVGVVLVRGTLLAGLIPPFHGPDEPAHFNYVQRLGEEGTLPVPDIYCAPHSAEAHTLIRGVLEGAINPPRAVPSVEQLPVLPVGDRAARATTGCGPAATYPPAYYASAAVGYAVSSEASLMQRLFASRMVSVLWACVTALGLFVLGVSFFGRVWDGVLLALLGATQPMIGFMSAVVNNDACLFACSACVLAALSSASRPAVPPGRALLAASLFALVGVLSKATFVLCLPVFFVVCGAALGPRQRRSWALAGLTFAPAVVVAVAWTLLWPASTGAVLSAPVMALSVREYVERYVLDLPRFQWLWVQMYWMVWGWVDTYVRAGYFKVLMYLLALGAAGLALGWGRATAKERGVVLLGLGGTAGLMVALHALELVVMRKTGMPFIQGRYLLPLFPLHAVAWVLGLRWLSHALRSPLDAAWLLVPTLLVLDVSAILRTLARYYA